MTTEPTEPRADHVQDAEEATQVQTTKVVVTGMTCGHCVNSVSEELKEIDEQEIWRAGALLFVVCSSGLLANYPLRQGRPLPPPGQAVIDSSQACFLAEHTQKHSRGAPLDLFCSASTLKLMLFKPTPYVRVLTESV